MNISQYFIGVLIKIYNVNMDTYVIPAHGFSSVNDFFTRSSHAAFRNFPQDVQSLGSPVD
jgi:phosphatidylserine decarboxylase